MFLFRGLQRRGSKHAAGFLLLAESSLVSAFPLVRQFWIGYHPGRETGRCSKKPEIHRKFQTLKDYLAAPLLLSVKFREFSKKLTSCKTNLKEDHPIVLNFRQFFINIGANDNKVRRFQIVVTRLLRGNVIFWIRNDCLSSLQRSRRISMF